jgi:predicted DNA-binding protein
MGYPWPASRLNSEDMARLVILRSQTKRPITQLLHEAVEAYYELMQKEE